MVKRKGRTKRYPTNYIKDEIIRLLLTGPLRFTDLRNKLGISKPSLSQHLSEFEKKGSVVSRKEGRQVFYMISEKAYTYDLTIKAKTLEFGLRKYVFEAYSQFENKPDKFVRRLTAVILFLRREIMSGVIREQVASKVAKNLLYPLLMQCLHFSDEYAKSLEDAYGELKVVKRLSRPDSLKKIVSVSSDKHGSTMVGSSSVLDAIETDSS